MTTTTPPAPLVTMTTTDLEDITPDIMAAATTEMREIKLGNSSPMRSGQRSVQEVETNCGKVNVTIIGERSDNALFPLVTLHDFGFNSTSQFRALQNSGEEADRFFSQFVTYHIDLPGQEEGAGDLHGEYRSLDELASVISHVRTSLNITKSMVLLGVGAGANIAMRYLLKHPKTVLGAIYIELTNDSETWVKWTQNKITDLVMKPSVFLSMREQTKSDVANDMLDRHFGRSEPPTHVLKDCRRYLMDNMLRNCNINNMLAFYNSFAQRKPIPDEGFKLDVEDRPGVLIISGRQGWRNDDSCDVRAQFHDAGFETTLLEPSPCYLFPLEEAPKKIALSMMLFIQSVGLGLSAGLPNPASVKETYDEPEVCLPGEIAMV